MESNRPTKKVTAGMLGGAFATVLAWVLDATAGVEMAAGVEAAFATIFAVGAGYLVKESDDA